MAPRKTVNALTGAAGEYYVAGQLSERGWYATMTIKNSPDVDILAQHAESGVAINVQSKATRGSQGWVLGVKDERPTPHEHAWFVLVALRGPGERPDFYMLPRNQVAAMLWVGHRNWLRKTAANGNPHKDNSMRNIHPPEIQQYKEQWDWLLQPTSSIPWQLPDWFERHVGTLGLPEGHPDALLFAAAEAEVAAVEGR